MSLVGKENVSGSRSAGAKYKKHVISGMFQKR